MPRHPDFEKIYKQFLKRYGKERGERFYYAWLNKHELDDTKPYGSQRTESFKWAKPVLAQYKEQGDGFQYWKVEAAFPVSSMNRNVYTEAELKASARTIIGKPLNLNHDVILEGDLAKIVDAEYEDDAVEVLIGIAKDGFGAEINQRIADGLLDDPPETAIMHSSLEADCKRGMEEVPEGRKCCGLVFTGLALLDKAVLPGIPLTRFYAAEAFTDEFEAMVAEMIAFNREGGETEDEAKAVPADTTKPLSAGPASQTPPAEPKVATATPPVATAGSGSPPNPVATATTSTNSPAVTTVTPGGTTTYTINYPEPPKEEPPQPPQPVPKQDTVPTKAEPTPPKGDEAPPKTDRSGDTPPQGTGGLASSPPPPAEDPNKVPETTDAILTEPGFWDRFNLYHKTHGFSRQDAFRLTSMDILKHIQKGKK